MRNARPTFLALGNSPLRTQRETDIFETPSSFVISLAFKNFFIFFKVTVVSIDNIIAHVKNSGNGDKFLICKIKNLF